MRWPAGKAAKFLGKLVHKTARNVISEIDRPTKPIFQPVNARLAHSSEQGSPCGMQHMCQCTGASSLMCAKGRRSS